MERGQLERSGINMRLTLKTEWFAEWKHNSDRDDWIGPYESEFDALEVMKESHYVDTPFRVFPVYRWEAG